MDVEAEPIHEEASTEATRGRRRAAIPLAIVIVLIAELAVRASAPRLKDPLLWPGWEAHNKAAAMDRLGDQGGASIVFVGSSVVNSGLNPHVGTRLWNAERPVFNAALNGSDMRMTSIWTREVVVPRLRPDVVVVGFNSGELNDHWNEPGSLYARMIRSHYGRRASGEGNALEKIDGWMIDRSYLVRYRSVLRKPMDAFRRKNPHKRFKRSTDWGAFRRWGGSSSDPIRRVSRGSSASGTRCSAITGWAERSSPRSIAWSPT